jgi:NAD(P)-dependent dehydrogenase (short-subunit alcohol dehydrogenase family)
LELAPHGIAVNAIAPGPVATEMFDRDFPSGGTQAQRVVAEIPLKRVGRPVEIAHVAAFLLDDDSGFMTGQVLHVDGGLSVGKISA